LIDGMASTPSAIVRLGSGVSLIGGAATVANQLRAAGAKVTFSPVLGEDPLKEFVLEGLASAGVEVLPIIAHARPTPHKNAFVCGDYRLLKGDTLDNSSISASHTYQIARHLHTVARHA